MKLSLCTWSYHRTLESKKLDFEGMIKLCATDLKIGGLDIIAELLPRTDKKYLCDLKKMMTDLNLTVSSLSPGNNYGQETDKALQDAVGYVNKWIDCAYILGSPVVRIFAGWVPKEKQARLWPNVVKGIKASAEYAKEFGITLAIEPHNDGGFLPTSVETFRLLKEVNSEYVKLNLDTGNYQDKDNYAAIEKSMPYAVHMHAKIHRLSPDGRELEFDYDKIFHILKRHNYRGFLAVEYEGKEDELKYVPKSFEMIRRFMKKYEIYS